MRGRTNEVFFAVFLNSGGEVIAYKKISEGTVSEAPVYPRLIVETLNVYGNGHTSLFRDVADAIAEGRAPDVDARAGRRALETVDIVLRDHIIVTSNGYFSFKNMRML